MLPRKGGYSVGLRESNGCYGPLRLPGTISFPLRPRIQNSKTKRFTQKFFSFLAQFAIVRVRAEPVLIRRGDRRVWSKWIGGGGAACAGEAVCPGARG